MYGVPTPTGYADRGIGFFLSILAERSEALCSTDSSRYHQTGTRLQTQDLLVETQAS